MKACLLALIISIVSVSNIAKAQTVYLSDPLFVNYLIGQGFGACITGQELDTACLHNGYNSNGVPTTYTGGPYMQISGNMMYVDGLEHFTFIRDLQVGGPYLTIISSLPPYLERLRAGGANLQYLPQLPNTISDFWLTNSAMTALPTLPDSLRELRIIDNASLHSLPALPSHLNTLTVWSTPLNSLPTLPLSLTSLSLEVTNITLLPTLPPNLLSLSYNNHWLTSQPVWPASLTSLSCSNTNTTTVSAFPPNLQFLNISYNNNLTSIPALPPTLINLQTNSDPIGNLPTLPAGLTLLFCSENQLTSLPLFPSTLKNIDVSQNNLTSIPPLPVDLDLLNCRENPQLSCLPPFQKIRQLDFTQTAITCLPAYGTVTTSYPSLSTVPLCGTFNNNGCTPFWNLAGQAYYTNNSNCAFDSSDVGIGNVKMMMYQGGVLQQQTFTGGDGFYSFDLSNVYGIYITAVDTAPLPFYVSCPAIGNDTSVISIADSFYTRNDFALRCKAGYDVGVESAYTFTRPRQAELLTLKVVAGDISQLIYGAHCAAGISGQVQLTYSGALHYQSMVGGAVAPTSVTNNTLTWNIADFATIEANTSFLVNFMVDTTAIVGSNVCFTLTISSSGADNNISNNTMTYCTQVIAALDPNEKEVYPMHITDTTKKWLTYTVRFQNVGNASARNIYIADTLDGNLDASSIELLTYSHHNITQVLPGGIVRFNFPNINLPDSNTNEPASHGYIQYKIKAKTGLPVGTIINNTAHIYFDFNAAVVTNTASTFYGNLMPTIATTQPLTFCQGDSVTFTAAGTGTFPVQWLKNGAPLSSETSRTITANSTGTYSVRVYYAGDSSTSTGTAITVNNTPSVSLSAATNNTCINGTAIALTPSPVGGALTGNGVANNSFYPEQGALGNNQINYSYTDVNGCMASANTSIMVNELPTVTLQPDTNAVTCADEPVALNGRPSGGVYTGSGVTDSLFNPLVAAIGRDTITYVYTDINGCTNSQKNVITNDICEGIEDITNQPSVSIYPNPTDNMLNININGIGSFNVKLYNTNGMLLHTEIINTSATTIDMSQLASGIYYLEVGNSQNKVTKKVVKM